MIHLPPASSAVWQIGTAVVQAVCSIGLLGWYVLAAHLERLRVRREKADDFDALVRLCRDLGLEAKAKTEAHLTDILNTAENPTASTDLPQRLAAWREDMTIVYVCLNEVPHYEVRNPAFSTALTRLWLEVDCRGLAPDSIQEPDRLVELLRHKRDRICREVNAMAALLAGPWASFQNQRRLVIGAKRRGYDYEPSGFVRGTTLPVAYPAAEHS